MTDHDIEDLPDFETLVETGAYYVYQGHFSVEEITLPAYVDDPDALDFSEADLQDGVRDYLRKHSDVIDDVEDSDEDKKDVDEATQQIDWSALFEEFDLDNPNALGHEYVSRTQLRTAIECSEQNIRTPADHAIEQAVEDGDIFPVTTGGTTAGYRLEPDSND